MAAPPAPAPEPSTENALFLGSGADILFFWHTYYGDRPADRLADLAGCVLNTLIEFGVVSPDEQAVVFSVSAAHGAVTPTSARPVSAPHVDFPPGVLADTLLRLISAKRASDDGYICVKVSMDSESRPAKSELYLGEKTPPEILGIFAAAPGRSPAMTPLLRVTSVKPFAPRDP